MDKKKLLRGTGIISDCLLVLGAVAVSIGVGLYSLPLGVIVGGMLSILGGILAGGDEH